jgi:PAS domain S-box-containing protein
MTSLPRPDAQSDSDHETIDRLRTILVASGAAAAWEWQLATKRFVGDAAFAALYGLTPEQALAGVPGAVFFSIIHPQDRDRIRLAIGGVARGAELLSKEYRIVPAGGDGVRWVHLRGRSLIDDNGQPLRFSGVLVDITEQKRLEEQLRISQSSGGVGTFEYTLGFGTVSVSAKFCSMLGLHLAPNLPLRTINAVVHPGDPPIVDPVSIRPAGFVSNTEFRIIPPGTTDVRWFMRRGEYIGDSEALGVRFSGVIYDITAAKHTEAQLRTLNDTLEQRVAERTRERDRIWRVSEDLLGVADASGVWISINPAWERLLGWSEGEILGRTTSWLEDTEQAQSISEAMAKLAEGARTFGFENRLRTRGGDERSLSWAVVRERDCFYCVARDVTEAKQAAEALAKTEEQLRQSQKMEAVGQLTGGLAHDFNNLLTAIAGSLELLGTRVREGRYAALPRYIDAAQSASKRAAALTHRLLAFSRRQTLSPKPTDILRLIAGMEDLLRRTMGPEISVQTNAPPDLWTTLVDQNQLENALLNLCINARDAMPQGGRLRIDLSNETLGKALSELHDLSPGEYVCLKVTDSGAGMPPDVLAHAFEPFFTTKPLGLGTGLGLSMIYGFARQSGGQAHIRSAPGDGTTVALYLPRNLLDDHAEGAEPVTVSLLQSGQGETVLVADDEAAVRMLVSDVLTDHGYHVVEAGDGESALQLLRSNVSIDLLVSDVGMPGGMNGKQLAAAARRLRPGLKVLFITGYAGQSMLDDTNFNAGADVMTKPFAMDALASRIRQLLDKPSSPLEGEGRGEGQAPHQDEA